MSSPEILVASQLATRSMSGGERTQVRLSRETVRLLQKVPLFSGLSRSHIRRLAGLAREASFGPGRIIVEKGVRGDAFYLILDGRAKVYGTVVPSGRALARFGPGDFFGEMALLDGGPRSASVVAETRVAAIKIPRAGFRQLLEKEPSVALRILEEMARRARPHEPTPTQ